MKGDGMIIRVGGYVTLGVTAPAQTVVIGGDGKSGLPRHVIRHTPKPLLFNQLLLQVAK